MIDNSDIVGHFQVSIYGAKNRVRGFQCPTMEDVRQEARKIVEDRRARRLPSTVFVQEITGKSPITFGNLKTIEI